MAFRPYSYPDWLPAVESKPPIIVKDEEFTKCCAACGKEFQTRCRGKFRCNSCQAEATHKRNQKYLAKRRLRRKLLGL